MCKAIVVSNDKHSAERLLKGPLGSLGVNDVEWVDYRGMSGAVVGVKADLGIFNTPGNESNAATVAALFRHELDVDCVTVEARKVRSNGKRGGSNRDFVDVSNVARWLEAKQPKAEQGPPCVVCGTPVTRKGGHGGRYGWVKTCSKKCLSERMRQAGKKGRAAQAAKAATTAPTETSTDMVQWNYQGTMIGMTEDRFLDMTAMWRAVGEPPNKRPTDYMKTKGANELVAEILRENTTGGFDPAGVYRPERERAANGTLGASTARGYWKLALDYAMYLNPAFKSWCYDRLLPVIGEEMGVGTTRPTQPLSATEQWRLAFNAHEELQAEVQSIRADVEEIKSRPEPTVDEDAIADKAATKATERIAGAWTERKATRRPRDPGPVLPLADERIGDATQLRHDLQESSVAALRLIGADNTNPTRYFASGRVNYHGRLLAGIEVGRPLKGPLTTLPAIAYTPLHEAFTSKEIIAKAARDTEEWLTR